MAPNTRTQPLAKPPGNTWRALCELQAFFDKQHPVRNMSNEELTQSEVRQAEPDKQAK